MEQKETKIVSLEEYQKIFSLEEYQKINGKIYFGFETLEITEFSTLDNELIKPILKIFSAAKIFFLATIDDDGFCADNLMVSIEGLSRIEFLEIKCFLLEEYWLEEVDTIMIDGQSYLQAWWD